ncbi:MAG: LysM peptidoglycan-binding domain-containing protein [Candidatus Omnitrophica bacterium]|nr:LysM peptidoglycan-binding domain-containing protein [Candidatus Omnitrophota bacterium]
MKNLRIILISIAILAVLIAAFAFLLRKKTPSLANTNLGSASGLYNQANTLLKDGELLKAKGILQDIIINFPDFKDISEVEKQLQDLNMRIIFSALNTPQTKMYEVQSGDSLAKIAKKFNTTVELIKRSNNISSDAIHFGRSLRIWTGKFSCVVDKSQNILTVMSGDELVKVYIVSTGANNHTPIGTYKIINKLVNPPWYKDGKVVPPESPQNILGTRWMGFDLEGYGIHGTTEPETIGMQITQGCVRMLNKDVEELYLLLPVGTEVTIID